MKKAHLLGLALLPALIPAQALAYEKGDWIVRAGWTQVAPDESSSNVFVGDADLGVGVSVANDDALGLNLAYFWDDHWAVELLAATPFEHDVTLNTVGALSSVKHLPPTLSAVYYPMDGSQAFQPYVGLGVNYTIFFDEEFTAANEEAGFADLDHDNSFGLSAQIGADFAIDEKWHINASVRWIDIDTDVTFTAGGAPGRVDVDIDPWVYTLSVGYRF